MSLFLDELDCGHGIVVDVCVPIDPILRIRRTIGTAALCSQCMAEADGTDDPPGRARVALVLHSSQLPAAQ